MRHVICILFSPKEQRGGWGGGMLPDFFRFLFFPCSADHERDWPPCNILSFFGLATNTLIVRSNIKNMVCMCRNVYYLIVESVGIRTLAQHVIY